MQTRALATASIAVAVGAAALYAGPVFRAALVADLGWSNELAAGAFAFGYLAAGATPIVSGMVADRFGASRLLLSGLLMSGLGLLGAALTSQPWHWYLAAGVGLSVAYYLVHVGGTLIATAGAARGTAVGIAIGTGVGLGLAGGPILAQAAVDARGWRDALTMLGIGALVVAAGMAWWTRRTGAPVPGASVDPRGEPADLGREAAGGRHEHAEEPEGAGGRTGARRRLLVGFFVGNALLAVFDESVYQHGFGLGLARGLSAQEASWLLGLASIGLTVGMLAGGPLSDLVGRSRVLVGAAALVMTTLLGLGQASATALWAWAGLFGVGLGASIAVRSAAWGDAFAGPGRGRAVGIVASGYPVGAALTIWLGAAWLDAGGGYERLYLIAAIAAALWGVVGGALTGSLAEVIRPSSRASQASASPDRVGPRLASA